jgi:hypothetical protein
MASFLGAVDILDAVGSMLPGISGVPEKRPEEGASNRQHL